MPQLAETEPLDQFAPPGLIESHYHVAGDALDNPSTTIVSACPEVLCLDDLFLEAEYIVPNRVAG